ncbi:6669_t:CDS:1, partial [Funneliformis mosseae]
VYKDTEILIYYEGDSPKAVWESIRILKKYGDTLFGLDHPQMLNAIQKANHIICNHNDWNNA